MGLVKIARVDEGYVVSVNRKRMVLSEADYNGLRQAMSEFERNDTTGDLVALEIDDKGFITVTRPLNPVASAK